MPGTVWGTASNLTAKFRSAPCLPPNTGKPLTRGPAPRQHSSQPLSAQASPQQRSRLHRYNVRHTTKSNFAGLLRIHAAIDSDRNQQFLSCRRSARSVALGGKPGCRAAGGAANDPVAGADRRRRPLLRGSRSPTRPPVRPCVAGSGLRWIHSSRDWFSAPRASLDANWPNPEWPFWSV